MKNERRIPVYLTVSQIRWLHTLLLYMERCFVSHITKGDRSKAKGVRRELAIQSGLSFRYPSALGGKRDG